MAEETIAKLQGELKEARDESKSKIEMFETKLRQVETDRAEYMAKEQTLRESLAQLSKEKEHLE